MGKANEICVVGFDKPERVEGQPWHGGHISEFPNLKPRAWKENISVVSGISSSSGESAYPNDLVEL